VLTGYSGHFVRVIRNRLTREFEKLVSQGASEEELDQLGAGKLQLAAVQGDVDYGSVMAGQIAGLVTQIKPAREIIGEIMEEAEDHLRRVNQALS
jgi:enoyl-[acyl-carrier protein] reductase II